jgi:hypothetical protein
VADIPSVWHHQSITVQAGARSGKAARVAAAALVALPALTVAAPIRATASTPTTAETAMLIAAQQVTTPDTVTVLGGPEPGVLVPADGRLNDYELTGRVLGVATGTRDARRHRSLNPVAAPARCPSPPARPRSRQQADWQGLKEAGAPVPALSSRAYDSPGRDPEQAGRGRGER